MGRRVRLPLLCHETRDPFRFTKRSVSPEISPHRSTPSFTQEHGRTPDVVGVGVNRIGKEWLSEKRVPS